MTHRGHPSTLFPRTQLLGLLIAAAALPAGAATFVSSDMTLANGNPLSGNYTNSTVFVGVNNSFQQVLGVKVDIVASAILNYNDQTGGGLNARSNSVVQVYGGTFGQVSSTGCCGGIGVVDTARVNISGGALDSLGISGAAPGAAGARADISGGTVQNYRAGVSSVRNGVLNVSGGTIRSTSGQAALGGYEGSIVNVSGGLVQSDGGPAIGVSGDSALTMTGGTVTALTAAGSGVVLSNLSGAPAQLVGGTINNGVRAERNLPATNALQGVLGGNVTVNGGVFAVLDAALAISGGNYGIYGGAGGAHFSALGSNQLDFIGSDLAVSGPVAGTLFLTNNYSGNYYTFTSGTFASGQSAVGLRIFDAVSLGSSTTGLQGGFTLSPVPEPAAFALLLAGLPLLAGALRRRRLGAD